MARLFGLNGYVRGRQGNNVFSVQNGTQVLKAYNPVVYNPRTTAQKEQRTKFSLAGKISSATPSEAIVGLVGNSRRGRRASFVKQIIRDAVVSGTPNNLVASIDYSKIRYSVGSVPQWSAQPTVQAIFSGSDLSSRINVTVQARQLSAGAPANYSELVIVALYDGATSTLEEVQVQEHLTGTVNTFNFRQGVRRDCYVVTYIAPYILDSTPSAPTPSNLAGGESAVSLTAVSTARLAGATFGESVMVAVNPVLGTSSMHSPSPADDTRGVVEEALVETAVPEGKKKK